MLLPPQVDARFLEWLQELDTKLSFVTKFKAVAKTAAYQVWADQMLSPPES